MTTEVWFRNPDFYVKEMVEVGATNIAWDRGTLIKKRIDPDKFCALYYGRALPWRALLIGEQGSAEIDADHPVHKPKGVYPTWTYGEPLALLEDMLANPPGENRAACLDMSVTPDERPVWGQEHRVVVTDVPPGNSGPGRKFLRQLAEMQDEFPNAIIHVHGLYSYKLAFGLHFAAADVEPRSAAAKGRVHLPSGVEERYTEAMKHPQWVTVLGFKPVDLEVPRNRCMYNIKAAMWAGENYEKIYAFKTRGNVDVDSESSDADHKPATTVSVFTGKGKALSGDKFHCDTCSLKNDCKYFRAGAVCSVPGSEPTELAKYFKTRDADTIIDGLGTLLAANTRRLERGMNDEEAFGELNGEVTKTMGQVFEQGVKLAKLIDPNLRGGAKVQVNVGQVGQVGAGPVQILDPRQQVASAIRELELRGIARENITPELIQGVLTGGSTPPLPAITGQVVDNEG